MKRVCIWILLVIWSQQAWSQYQVSEARAWDKFPPEAQEKGFGLHTSQCVQMDNDPAMEEVLLFCSDNGHYPYFDVFRQYIVVVDYYTKAIKYKSDIVRSTERILLLEDRNNDQRYEIYRKYFKEGEFTVDEEGNNLRVTWVYDCIEFKNTKK